MFGRPLNADLCIVTVSKEKFGWIPFTEMAVAQLFCLALVFITGRHRTTDGVVEAVDLYFLVCAEVLSWLLTDIWRARAGWV